MYARSGWPSSALSASRTERTVAVPWRQISSMHEPLELAGSAGGASTCTEASAPA